MWTGLNWIKVMPNGGVLWTRWWTFWLHKSGELLDELSDCELFKEYAARWSFWTNEHEYYVKEIWCRMWCYFAAAMWLWSVELEPTIANPMHTVTKSIPAANDIGLTLLPIWSSSLSLSLSRPGASVADLKSPALECITPHQLSKSFTVSHTSDEVVTFSSYLVLLGVPYATPERNLLVGWSRR